MELVLSLQKENENVDVLKALVERGVNVICAKNWAVKTEVNVK
jgi:hypothetical protein